MNERISRKTQFLDATSQREQFQLQQKETIRRSSISFYGIVADSTAKTVSQKPEPNLTNTNVALFPVQIEKSTKA